MQNGKAQLRGGNERTNERSPQADQQQDRSEGRADFQDDWRRRGRRQQAGVHDWNRRRGAQEDKAGSGQTARKTGEESLHRMPCANATAFRTRAPASKVAEGCPSFGGR